MDSTCRSPESDIIASFNQAYNGSIYIHEIPLIDGLNADLDALVPSDYIRGLLSVHHAVDLVQEVSGWLTTDMLRAHYLYNVTDLWHEFGIFDSPAVAFAPQTRGSDGAMYMLPLLTRIRGFYLNTRYLPTMPHTFEALLNYCRAHKSRTGSGCILLWAVSGPRDDLLARLLDVFLTLQHGPEYVLAIQTGTVPLTDGRYAATLDLLERMIADGCFEYDFSLAKFESGDTPILSTVLGVTKALVGTPLAAPETLAAMAIASTPPFAGTAWPTPLFASLDRVGIPRVSSKPDKARTYLRELFSPANARHMLVGATMSWPISASDALVASLNGSDPELDTVFSLVRTADYVVPTSDDVFTSVLMRQAWRDAVSTVAAGGAITSAVATVEAVRVAEYVGEALAPVPSTPPGLYQHALNFSLTTFTAGADVHYTLDGSPPFSDSPKYRPDQPILLVETGSVLVRAVAIRRGLRNSPVFEGRYTIQLPVLPGPPSTESDAASARMSPSVMSPAAAIILSVSIPLLICATGAAIFVMWRRARRSTTVITLEGAHEAIPFDELRMLRAIGTGAYGAVSLAEWRATRVAVKILHRTSISESDLSPDKCQAFLSEAAIIMSLRHPNIVTFMGVSLVPPALVTEFLDRGALYDYIHNPAMEIDISARMQWAYEIAAGVAFLHESNTLHLDLKSLNVLLSSSWTAKLCDFGLSALARTAVGPDEETKAGSITAGTKADASGAVVLGTMYWTAPELLMTAIVATPTAVAPPADVYSLGIVLYELFARSLPYPLGSNTFALTLDIMRGKQRPDVAAVVADTPQEVVQIMTSAWATDPQERPTASNVAVRLRSALAADPDPVVYPQPLHDEPCGDAVIMVSMVVGSFAELAVAVPDDLNQLMTNVHEAIYGAAAISGGYCWHMTPYSLDYAFSTGRRASAFVEDVRNRMAKLPIPERLGLLLPSTLAGCEGVYGPVRLAIGIAVGPVTTSRDTKSLKLKYFGPPVVGARALASNALPGMTLASTDAVQMLVVTPTASHQTVPATPWPAEVPAAGRGVMRVTLRADASAVHDMICYAALWEATQHVLTGSDDISRLAVLVDEIATVSAGGSTEPLQTGPQLAFTSSLPTADWLVRAKELDVFEAESFASGLGSYAEIKTGKLRGTPVEYHRFLLQNKYDVRYSLAVAAEFGRIRKLVHRGNRYLVPVMYLCLEPGRIGYFAPQMPGGTLGELLETGAGGSHTLIGMLSAGLGLARGLGELARLDIPALPFSIRLSNVVVVGSNGTTIDVAIRDYGFMAPTEAIGTMTVAQTAAYEAPELLRGETSEAGAEQALAFALGSALFHLISGVPAWHGHNAMDTASRIVAGERPELLPRSSIASSIPTAVTDLVTALWQDNPTARPKLVDAMTTLGEALDRILPRSARVQPASPALAPVATPPC
ncbi:TKL protein kinase [Thecamonas trahens ATCC 50062]|uniref:TKL protein kinase n=1 Tax=Thecamonas trahens ATCC 50062 TaxID=461836 RepID=A0A0L0DS46_THETB|nr:TKL protein kinase [Thecamonas trahens ATCC 50062]KNC55085.1 TKL protein kinase [Thecamonas trahens ATCC 50062]|eukprot:XP_013753269.1 TKL protein kinase [Thecamonas trahens ATCC 50062]